MEPSDPVVPPTPLDDSSLTDSPPSDAEEWTEEQWLAWLKATDAADVGSEGRTPATVAGRITHTAGAHALGQTMLGLYRVIYGQRNDEIVIVAEANSDPEEEPALDLHLDPGDPERSYVVIRRETPAPE